MSVQKDNFRECKQQMSPGKMCVIGKDFGGPCPGDSGSPLVTYSKRTGPQLIGLVSNGAESCKVVFIVKASDVTPDHPPLVRRDCRGSSPGCLTTQTGSASPRTQPGGSAKRGCTGTVPDTIRTITVRAITIVTTIVSISLIIDTSTTATITPSTSNISLILKMHFFHQNQNSDHSQALGNFITVNISINFNFIQCQND